VKAFEKIRFRPMYAWANMGHPSRTIDRSWEMKSAEASKLIWTRGVHADSRAPVSPPLFSQDT
jgi:hypothetical protein